MLVGLAVIEVGMWMGVTGSQIIRVSAHEERLSTVLLSAGMVLVWVSRARHD